MNITLPRELDVLDQHHGFTAETKPPYKYPRGKLRVAGRVDATGCIQIGDTRWRPGHMLRKTLTGRLVASGRSFYQMNNDVTAGLYDVPGYPYLVVVWYDNKTGNRIA